MTTLDFTGRAVLITGGSRGIGAAMVRRFSDRGANVLFTYRNRSDLADALVHRHPGVISLAADSAILVDAHKAVHQTITQFGKLDILVINAGISRDRVCWKLPEEDWDAVLQTNLKGAFCMVQAATPHLRAQEYGRIVTVASINGIRGKGGQSAYAASKAGLIGLTKSIARELGPKHITVNAVAPGWIDTDMTTGLPEDIRRRAIAETATGRIGTPDDVASAVLFLSSDMATHITGQVIQVDGGQLT